MVTASRVSTIEKVPAMMIALLEQAGDLPDMPEAYAVKSGPGFRKPRIEDGNALTWLLAWDGPRTDGFAFRKPSGILGYEDRYDFHIASEVRVITYLAGRRRAVIDLLQLVKRESRDAGRRLIGAIDLHNQPLARVLQRIGATPTRTVFEDLG